MNFAIGCKKGLRYGFGGGRISGRDKAAHGNTLGRAKPFWEETMKKLLMLTAAVGMIASAASAERYVMITHTQGTDPFWPVVEKGGRDAAAAIGADFEYNFDP
jgi:hypothetical protein